MDVHTANKILYQSLRHETKTMFADYDKAKRESSLNRQLQKLGPQLSKSRSPMKSPESRSKSNKRVPAFTHGSDVMKSI